MKDLFRKNVIFRFIAVMTLAAFLSLSVVPSQALAQGALSGLPQPGVMVPPSPSFNPVSLRGLQVHPDNPLRFDFIMDTGDTQLEGQAFQDEAGKLIRYFLASLTIPEEQFWVNLSPYEQDRIIGETLGQTEMGRDLLAQDYILKQLTATLVDPNSDLGRKFWDRVYKKAYELYGTTQIPANTFNKVWIVPDEAVVYEEGTYAFVGGKHLKVMLEEDYLSMQNNIKKDGLGVSAGQVEEIKKVAAASSSAVREVLIPEIEKEVNVGKSFAALRQVFDALILATWYKKVLKESLLGQVYVDRNKIKGLEGQRITGARESQSRSNPITLKSSDPQTDVEMIYAQYVESFKKGVFNLIKIERDPYAKKMLPRKYFSGGVSSGIVKVKDLVIRKLSSLGAQARRLFSSVSPQGRIQAVTADLGTSGGKVFVPTAATNTPEMSIDSEKRGAQVSLLAEPGQGPKLISSAITPERLIQRMSNEVGIPENELNLSKSLVFLKDGRTLTLKEVKDLPASEALDVVSVAAVSWRGFGLERRDIQAWMLYARTPEEITEQFKGLMAWAESMEGMFVTEGSFQEFKDIVKPYATKTDLSLKEIGSIASRIDRLVVREKELSREVDENEGKFIYFWEKFFDIRLPESLQLERIKEQLKPIALYYETVVKGTPKEDAIKAVDSTLGGISFFFALNDLSVVASLSPWDLPEENMTKTLRKIINQLNNWLIYGNPQGIKFPNPQSSSRDVFRFPKSLNEEKILSVQEINKKLGEALGLAELPKGEVRSRSFPGIIFNRSWEDGSFGWSFPYKSSDHVFLEDICGLYWDQKYLYILDIGVFGIEPRVIRLSGCTDFENSEMRREMIHGYSEKLKNLHELPEAVRTAFGIEQVSSSVGSGQSSKLISSSISLDDAKKKMVEIVKDLPEEILEKYAQEIEELNNFSDLQAVADLAQNIWDDLEIFVEEQNSPDQALRAKLGALDDLIFAIGAPAVSKKAEAAGEVVTAQASPTNDPLGGIDLGAASSTLQIKRDGSGMPLPLSQQPLELQSIEGFTPFIINVAPFNPAVILSQLEEDPAPQGVGQLSLLSE